LTTYKEKRISKGEFETHAVAFTGHAQPHPLLAPMPATPRAAARILDGRRRATRGRVHAGGRTIARTGAWYFTPSASASADSYLFAADLAGPDSFFLLDHHAGDRPVDLVGHRRQCRDVYAMFARVRWSTRSLRYSANTPGQAIRSLRNGSGS
jgi:hypothetical protein